MRQTIRMAREWKLSTRSRCREYDTITNLLTCLQVPCCYACAIFILHSARTCKMYVVPPNLFLTMEREYGREGKVKRAANSSPNRKTTLARRCSNVHRPKGLQTEAQTEKRHPLGRSAMFECTCMSSQSLTCSARSLGDVRM